MPISDPEKKKEYDKKRYEQKKVEEQENKEVQPGMGDRPMVEDAESVYGSEIREAEVEKIVSKKYGKSNTWAFIMYTDSAPADWEDRLRMLGVAFAVSPLHNADVTQTGDLKKAHWHGILHWPRGAVTYKTAKSITRGVLMGTIPIPLVSPRGYFRYFCHLDNSDKAQYDEKDIITGNGFDIGDFLDLTAKEKLELRKEVLKLIEELDVTEYYDLVTHAMYNESDAVFDFVSQNTMFFNTAIKSRKYSRRTDAVMESLIDLQNKYDMLCESVSYRKSHIS